MNLHKTTQRKSIAIDIVVNMELFTDIRVHVLTLWSRLRIAKLKYDVCGKYSLIYYSAILS